MGRENPTPGWVSLVGAGPGDPGLLTVRGAELLASADVVLYDRLANEALLALARSDAELIAVGKAASHHMLPQEDINALLAKKALEGKCVCRLKGGDPFVFGRGGEEGSHLASLGIPFEVVPGVSSSIAAPAYAGIPVTDRRHARSFAVITGHTRNQYLDIDWNNLKADTLVFLMGHTNLEIICRELRNHGRPGETPAAVVERGTTPAQRTVTGNLENIALRVREARLGTPSLLVVGHVVSLRDELNWFERRPLAGRRILVTRPRAQAGELATLLSRQGAEVHLHPLIRTQAVALPAGTLETLAQADWVLFASANGVEHLVEGLWDLGSDVRALGRARVAAIGNTSATALRSRGIRVDFVPSSFVSESFASEIPEVEGRRVVVVRALRGREAMVRVLRERGALVEELTAYETLPAAENLPSLSEFDGITFTSPSTVEALLALASPADLTQLRLGRTVAAAIGPITAHALQQADIPVGIQAEAATATGLAEAFASHFSAGVKTP